MVETWLRMGLCSKQLSPIMAVLIDVSVGREATSQLHPADHVTNNGAHHGVFQKIGKWRPTRSA